MIVSLNTQTLNELSQESISVSTEISAAFDCLSPIVEHNDWNCSERDLINEMINTIKLFSKELKESAESFSSSLQQTASSFDDLEKKTPSSMQSTHAIFAEKLSIKTPTSNNENTSFAKLELDLSHMLRQIPSPGWSPWKRFQFETLIKPIYVIKPAPAIMIGGKDGILPVNNELAETMKKLGINKTIKINK